MNLYNTGRQLFLPVQTRLEERFEHYLGEANTQAVDTLKNFIEQQQETLVFLTGPEATGKTHLLSASVHYFESFHQSEHLEANYFSLSELINVSLDQEKLSELSSFLENFDLVALDNLDSWLNWLSENDHDSAYLAEKFLFGLFNFSKEQGKQLLIASRTVPSRLGLELKDLQSRLSSGLLLTLTKLDDHEKDQLIRAMAKLKGFMLDDDVSGYILKRCGRDLPNLLQILDKLDRASLIEKRKLTIPFVKKTLNW